MQHFFVTPAQVEGETIYITGSDVNHMRNVLRLRVGEEVMVSDGNNCRYRCAIEEYHEERAMLTIDETLSSDTELPAKLYLFQGLPKQEKMELIVQKCVELGVYQIIPVAMKRCVVRLNADKAAKKVKRWNSIAESAAKQAGRGIIPRVLSVMAYEEALVYAEQLDLILLPYELAQDMRATKSLLSSVRSGQSIAIFIGPEGGFEKEEVESALSRKANPITLGKRILRTETAGLAIVAALMFHLEG